MWGRYTEWCRECDEEQLAVLRDPAVAAGVPSGWRRIIALKIAALSPIERQEMVRFTTTYRGARLWRAIAKLSLVFSVAGALFKLALLPKMPLLLAVAAGNFVGFAAAMALITVWFNHEKYTRPNLKMIAVVTGLGLVGGLYGGAVAVMAKGDSWQHFMDILPNVLICVGFGVLLLVALPGVVVTMVRNRHFALLAAQLKHEAEQARLARELSETQLRLLRAQIEPHFLFNTLGAVQQLAEQGAPRAAELTAHLIDFLRASMSDMRCEQVSLATEFGLVESYLAVMQIRMGERLRFRIDLPSSLAATRIPSMLVLTLAENAIKHGIEPSLRGGDITVTAQEDANQIRIAVHDSGVGMSDTPGNGTGLENVRSRLRLTYGESASLALSEAEPGLLAELLIPRKDAQ